MILTVIFYIFVATTAVQLIYFLCFSSILFVKEKKKTIKQIPVSIIICAKNEEHNLQAFLPSIINQKYADFEIILINDASSDDTLEVMESFKEQHANIKIVNVKNNEAFWGNKKYALTLGIKAATNEHLLFTDADCEPVSRLWVQSMTQHFSSKKTIVLGYGKYKTQKTFVNLLVRFETFLTAIQYFSYAKLGSPYMGVGRNLAYTKSEFFKTNGFIKHIQIRSGDDDLFIQEAATKINTAICLNRKSFTISNPPVTLKEWFRQKRRHVSTASYYQFKHQFFLGLYFASKFFFYVSAILLFFLMSWKLITPIFGVYILSLYLVFGFSAKRLQEKKVIFFLPFLDLFLLLFQFSIFISNTFSKPTHWK
ncbi:putative glycosyltransferase EpsJ [Polaribacter huanghezhanensis]|uniref:glycosyltransferase n=1 Tax=Polaribacter huanghezhanensis TaxID=1354726 RepID=UPI0026487503|nr:glycosyltransferase [Polaribacter huanghezhanensis]WKD86953.1 putative glycosyltransferase EpsJ [Polaribacter huanghezhanensis]